MIELYNSGGCDVGIHWANNPIPLEHLTYFLEKNMPKDLSNREKLKWEKVIVDIVKSYESYVNTVCGINVNDQEVAGSNTKKWESFKELMDKWNYLSYNYSLHY